METCGDRATMEARFSRLRKSLPWIDRIWIEDSEDAHNYLLSILSLGEAPLDEIIRYPHLASPLLKPGYTNDPFINNPDFSRNPAVFKRHVWLKILILDRIGLLNVEDTVSQLTTLADQVTEFAFKSIHQNLGGIALWAMGKWGGEELNASSDIDPVFYTDNSLDPEEVDRIIREWLKLMMPPGEPQIYPVDLRLRPEGSSGPLAWSYSKAESYFFQRAAFWEKIAYLRARRVFGPEPGWFREMLDSFLFQPGENPHEISAKVGGILQNIRSKAKARDIKRAPGGIRDVEFYLASIQLTDGKNIPGMRTGSCFQLLKKVRENNLLPGKDVDEMLSSYSFLRKLENALQAENDYPEFCVPEPGTSFHKRLAWIFEYPDPDQFERDFHSHRDIISSIVERELIDTKTQIPANRYIIDPQDHWMEIKEVEDLSTTENPWKRVTQYKNVNSILNRMSGKWGSVQRMFDPAQLNNYSEDVLIEIFTRLESAVNSYGGPRSWIFAFSNDKRILSLISRIIIRGKRICDEASQRPYLWDQLITGLSAEQKNGTDFSLSEDKNILDYYKHQLGDNLFNLGKKYLNEDINLEDFLKYWNEILDSTIRSLVKYHDQVNKLESGKSNNINSKLLPSNFDFSDLAVIALGKWGGRDAAPDSDLDLLFISPDLETRELAGIQNLTALWMNRIELSGILNLDVRLRPEGSGSPIVITISRLEEYLSSRAQPWEKIALGRARLITGEKKLGKQSVKIIRNFISDPASSEEIVRIDRARKKTARETKFSRGIIHIKKAIGGMMDFEFATHFAGWNIGIDPRDEWWEYTVPDRMKYLAEKQTQIDWTTAKKYYHELRRWEIVSILSGGRRKGIIHLKGSNGDTAARFLGLTLDELNASWSNISKTARKIYTDTLEQ